MHPEALSALGNLFGDRLRTSLETRICYSFDATGKKFLPDAVVYPVTAEEVRQTVLLANLHRFPVIPRGAGSGFSGGSLPVQGGVVLSTERMDRIVSIDTENLYAVVEPGVVTGTLKEEARKKGLFYPPDPASLKFSTLGGNIAECAGGMCAVKYGVTRDYVLGLEAVLGTGELVRTGVATAKGVVGYDLTRMLVGSEGTLGIVTRATLRLIPLPEAAATLLALFHGNRGSAEAVNAIVAARVTPSAMELMDRTAIDCVQALSPSRSPREPGAPCCWRSTGRRARSRGRRTSSRRCAKPTEPSRSVGPPTRGGGTNSGNCAARSPRRCGGSPPSSSTRTSSSRAAASPTCSPSSPISPTGGTCGSSTSATPGTATST